MSLKFDQSNLKTDLKGEGKGFYLSNSGNLIEISKLLLRYKVELICRFLINRKNSFNALFYDSPIINHILC